jgi:hypothetical protein
MEIETRPEIVYDPTIHNNWMQITAFAIISTNGEHVWVHEDNYTDAELREMVQDGKAHVVDQWIPCWVE